LATPGNCDRETARVAAETGGSSCEQPRGWHAIEGGRFHDSRASQIPLSVAQEKSSGGIAFAVASFLANLRLSGSEAVLGSLALSLAEAMEEAPLYARGKLARELREVIASLAEAELSPANLSLLQGVEL
jgi:hypothetical protein